MKQPNGRPSLISVESTTESSSSSSSSMDSSPTTTPTVEVKQPRPLQRSNSMVTFAPLPQVSQRKRRSRVPLGVAGRAELMRRRRTGSAGYGENEGYASGEEQNTGPTEDELDVVVMAMGKFIKDTGRHLWKRVSSNGRKKGEGEGEGEKERKSTDRDGEILGIGMGEDAENEVREVVFIEGENGVQVQFPQDISQTETVGRGYAWRTVSIVTKPDKKTTTTTKEIGGEENRATI